MHDLKLYSYFCVHFNRRVIFQYKYLLKKLHKDLSKSLPGGANLEEIVAREVDDWQDVFGPMIIEKMVKDAKAVLQRYANDSLEDDYSKRYLI